MNRSFPHCNADEAKVQAKAESQRRDNTLAQISCVDVMSHLHGIASFVKYT